jgi:hypothetical protein
MEKEYIYDTQSMSLRPKEKESKAWQISCYVLIGFLFLICLNGCLQNNKVITQIQITKQWKN